MKTKFFGGRKLMAILGLTIFSAMMLTSCKKDEAPAVNNTPYTISGTANSAQMVPPGTATGTGSISGSFDPATNQLTYTSNWNGLTGAPTSGGFYSGASGTAGTALGTPWT